MRLPRFLCCCCCCCRRRRRRKRTRERRQQKRRLFCCCCCCCCCCCYFFRTAPWTNREVTPRETRGGGVCGLIFRNFGRWTRKEDCSSHRITSTLLRPPLRIYPLFVCLSVCLSASASRARGTCNNCDDDDDARKKKIKKTRSSRSSLSVVSFQLAKNKKKAPNALIHTFFSFVSNRTSFCFSTSLPFFLLFCFCALFVHVVVSTHFSLHTFIR